MPAETRGCSNGNASGPCLSLSTPTSSFFPRPRSQALGSAVCLRTLGKVRAPPSNGCWLFCPHADRVLPITKLKGRGNKNRPYSMPAQSFTRGSDIVQCRSRVPWNWGFTNQVSCRQSWRGSTDQCRFGVDFIQSASMQAHSFTGSCVTLSRSNRRPGLQLTTPATNHQISPRRDFVDGPAKRPKRFVTHKICCGLEVLSPGRVSSGLQLSQENEVEDLHEPAALSFELSSGTPDSDEAAITQPITP